MTTTNATLRNSLAFQMALDRQRLAHRVVELRERNRLTQMGLMAKSGVSLRTIQRVENPADQREVRFTTLERLAEALGVEPEQLTARDEIAAAHQPPTVNGTPDLLGEMGVSDNELVGALNKIHHQLQKLNSRLDTLENQVGDNGGKLDQFAADWAEQALPAIQHIMAEAEAKRPEPAAKPGTPKPTRTRRAA